MSFQASIVDATRCLENNRYALTTGVEWGILIDNQTDEMIDVTVSINGKRVPTSWIFGADQKGTLDKPMSVRHYFVFKAPSKAGTSNYTKVLVRAHNTEGKLIGAINFSLVDIRDPKNI